MPSKHMVQFPNFCVKEHLATSPLKSESRQCFVFSDKKRGCGRARPGHGQDTALGSVWAASAPFSGKDHARVRSRIFPRTDRAREKTNPLSELG
jgi:hypothetical protein